MGKVEEEEEEQVSFNHVTVWETNNLKDEVQLVEAAETLEDGGQAIINELKELNLATKDNLRLIYMNAMLMPKEEKDYFKALSEYRDVLV